MSLIDLTPTVHHYRLHIDRHHKQRTPYLVINEYGCIVGQFHTQVGAHAWMRAEELAGRAVVELHSVGV